ncbi:MAG: FIST C-terminal domain-containing protein [Gammaproteobacteria bacterium]|nr:FIST C-terminal domain-containing protein [Gammaproteobacteria bacterium]
MMKQFLLAQSAGHNSDDLLADCLNQLGSIPPEANFGFLYLSDQLASAAEFILNRLKQATDIEYWIGTVGIGVIASNTEFYDEPAMVVMLADFNEADFHILPNFITDTTALSGELAHWCQANDFNVGLLHADPTNPATPTLLSQLGEDIPTAFLVGGITSSRGANIQFATEALHGGISGVLFSQAVPIKTNLTQGCTPIGKRHVVTQCDDNLIHSLDNRPALDVLTEDAGDTIAQDWQQAANYIFAGIVNKSSDLDDYSIRQLIGIDTEEKVIAIGDYLQHNDEIIFCRRDGNSAMEDMDRMLLELKLRLNSPIRGGVYVSCLGRGRHQFGNDSQEVRFIHSVLGDFPLVGFFANGEIHKNSLYSFTGVLTLFV